MYIADPFETIKKLTFPTFRNLRCHSVLGILVFWLSRSFLFWVSPLGYYFESETEKNNDSLDFSQRSKLFGESANSYRDLFNFK